MLRKAVILGLLAGTLSLSGCGWCGNGCHPWFGWWKRRCCDPCPAPCGPAAVAPAPVVAAPPPGAVVVPPPDAARFGPTPDAVVRPGYFNGTYR